MDQLAWMEIKRSGCSRLPTSTRARKSSLRLAESDRSVVRVITTLMSFSSSNSRSRLATSRLTSFSHKPLRPLQPRKSPPCPGSITTFRMTPLGLTAISFRCGSARIFSTREKSPREMANCPLMDFNFSSSTVNLLLTIMLVIPLEAMML